VAIARRLGCRRVLVPEPGAALAAAGALLSDLTARYQRCSTRRAATSTGPASTRCWRGSRRSARLCAGRRRRERFRIDWSTEARYPDQAWEIEVPLRGSRFASPEDVAGLLADFHRTHAQVFAVSDPARRSRRSLERRSPLPDRQRRAGRVKSAATAAKLPRRRVRFLQARESREVEVYRFEAIPADARIAGPAIVESSSPRSSSTPAPPPPATRRGRW